MKCVSGGFTSAFSRRPKLWYTFQAESLRELGDSTYFPDTNFRGGERQNHPSLSEMRGPNYTEF